MALVKCPECGKEISDRADKCLNCRYPITKITQEKNNISRERDASLKVTKIANVALGIFGILMLIGVASSHGGFAENKSAAIVSLGMLAAVAMGLIAIKIRNKVFAYCVFIPYAIALTECSGAIKISSAYLLAELFIGIVAILTAWYIKKSKII